MGGRGGEEERRRGGEKDRREGGRGKDGEGWLLKKKSKIGRLAV